MALALQMYTFAQECAYSWLYPGRKKTDHPLKVGVLSSATVDAAPSESSEMLKGSFKFDRLLAQLSALLKITLMSSSMPLPPVTQKQPKSRLASTAFSDIMVHTTNFST